MIGCFFSIPKSAKARCPASKSRDCSAFRASTTGISRAHSRYALNSPFTIDMLPISSLGSRSGTLGRVAQISAMSALVRSVGNW